MNRGRALEWMDQICGEVDRERWQRRVFLRRTVENTGNDAHLSPEVVDQIRRWAVAELGVDRAQMWLETFPDRPRMKAVAPAQNGHSGAGDIAAANGDTADPLAGESLQASARAGMIDQDPRVAGLESEILLARHAFGEWTRKRQRAQLAVWAGLLRKFNAEGRMSETRQNFIYAELRGYSKNYRPGHVDAFLMRFEPHSWEDYIAEKRIELRAALLEDENGPAPVPLGDTCDEAVVHLDALLNAYEDEEHALEGFAVVAQALHVESLAGGLDGLKGLADRLFRHLTAERTAESLLRRLLDVLPAEKAPDATLLMQLEQASTSASAAV